MVSAKLQNWMMILIKTKLWPLKEELMINEISPNVRAIKFNIFENLGTLPIEKFKTILKIFLLKKKYSF